MLCSESQQRRHSLEGHSYRHIRKLQLCLHKLEAFIQQLHKLRLQLNCGGIISRQTFRIQEKSDIQDTDLDGITNLVNHISIQQCKSIDWSQTWKLITNRTHHLKIVWFNRGELDDNAIVVIVRYIPRVRELCLGENRVSDGGAIAISEKLKHLRLLNVNTNRIGHEGAVALVLGLPKLERFFPNSNNITKLGYILLKALPSTISW